MKKIFLYLILIPISIILFFVFSTFIEAIPASENPYCIIKFNTIEDYIFGCYKTQKDIYQNLFDCPGKCYITFNEVPLTYHSCMIINSYADVCTGRGGKHVPSENPFLQLFDSYLFYCPNGFSGECFQKYITENPHIIEDDKERTDLDMSGILNEILPPCEIYTYYKQDNTKVTECL